MNPHRDEANATILNRDGPMTETEALKELGLPKSPVIDLAICTVAELLKPLDAQSPLDQRCTLITRYRTASRTAREALSIDESRAFYCVMLGSMSMTKDRA